MDVHGWMEHRKRWNSYCVKMEEFMGVLWATCVRPHRGGTHPRTISNKEKPLMGDRSDTQRPPKMEWI